MIIPLIVNQVSDNIDESAFSIENKARSAKPALGLFWRNLIDEAFLIEKFEDSTRTIEATKSFRFADIKFYASQKDIKLIHRESDLGNFTSFKDAYDFISHRPVI